MYSKNSKYQTEPTDGLNMKSLHLFDPKNIDILEAEDRKIWQDPEEILGEIRLNSDYIAADLGCGSGFFTFPISRRVKKIYGIDVQEEMLKFVAQKIRREKIENVELLLSEEGEIPLENHSVDLLLSVNTLHEFSDKEKMIKEIQRVLKPNGKAVIVDFKKEETSFGPPVAIRISSEQAKQLFEKYGFKALKSKKLQYHYLIIFLYIHTQFRRAFLGKVRSAEQVVG
jgi:ubiquinone/menaquinone biosynthesis C-methylase UbiE